MVEPRAIIEMWQSRPDETAVLATLVRVQGSSYRRPGARMYIHRAGHVGAISGGCLEGEVVRKAAWITRNGAAVERYSTLFDEVLEKGEAEEAREIPYGLGCGGVIDVMLEPVRTPEADAMLRAMEAAQRGETFYGATVLPAGGTRLARVVVRGEGSAAGDSIFFASAHLNAEQQTQLALLANGTKVADTVSVSLGKATQDVFLEPIVPPQRLVILGAGDDVRPLARMANLLGWHIAVADGRAWLAQAARFPEAKQVLALEEGANNLEELRIVDRDVVVLLTHSFDQDKTLLHKLLPLELRYLGLLGARHRSRILLQEVGQQLGWTPEQCLERVHAPVGLDLGGDSPEAVALAILAEIQAELHAKRAISRRMSEEALHSIPDRPYVPTQCPIDNDPEPSDAYPTIEITH